MKYIIVGPLSQAELIVHVNNMIEQGYIPLGGPIQASVTSSGWLIQAMVLETVSQ